MKHQIPLLVLLLISLTACGPTHRTDPDSTIITGRDVLAAMHARYDGRWYRNLQVTQEVVFHDAEGKPQPQQTWVETISLPGRVRSVIGDEKDGNIEIYAGGAFTVIKDGKPVQQLTRPHPVLHIGYDVYCQPPEFTAHMLEAAGFDLATISETTWQDQGVYVVGAAIGDDSSPQFWIDRNELLCRRIITRSQSGKPVDIHFTKYAPFAGVWLCTELRIHVEGRLLIHEWDVGHVLLDEIDDDVFKAPET